MTVPALATQTQSICLIGSPLGISLDGGEGKDQGQLFGGAFVRIILSFFITNI